MFIYLHQNNEVSIVCILRVINRGFSTMCIYESGLFFLLQTNNSVTSLDLSGNNIGHKGLLDVLRMLDENTSITYLVSQTIDLMYLGLNPI